MTQFNQFDLDPKVLKVLEEMGFETPTPIQEQAIPKVLEGMDIIASAQTGTGKTGAFMLPIMHLLCQPSFRNNVGPQVLVLVPTRELAMQVAEEAKKFSKHVPRVKTVCIYGGVPYPLQRRALAGRYEILVATPGRLMDHMEQGRVDLSRIKMLVLDEADRMLDMGFVSAVEHISAAIPTSKQTLLFSATIDKKILPISKKLQNNPFQIEVAISKQTRENIEQRLYYVDGLSHKMRLLENLLETTDIQQSIVFTSTVHQANSLSDHLHDRGYLAGTLHGQMNQRQRTRTIEKLRSGHIKMIIATDVAARGIDIPAISHVFNFDLPFQSEDFIHRIGRTGRAGAKGTAITFATYEEEFKVSKIHQLLDGPIAPHIVEGLEPKAKPAGKSFGSRPPSSRRPRGQGHGRSSGQGQGYGSGRPSSQGQGYGSGRPSSQGQGYGSGRPSSQGQGSAPKSDWQGEKRPARPWSKPKGGSSSSRPPLMRGPKPAGKSW